MHTPDMILLDVNMPLMNGLECLQHLKGNKLLKDIPVAMYSTSRNAREIKQAIDAGAVCFFNKPYSYPQLVTILKKIVAHLKEGSLHTLPDILEV